MRIRLAALIVGAALVTSCRSEPTAPDDHAAAADAAQTLLHLADSLSAHGGTTNEVVAYRGLAALLVGTGRLSSVTISVDGAPAEYLATAQEVQLDWCPAGTYCTAVTASPPPDRSVIAWQKSNPRRVVQLFAPSAVYLYALSGSTSSVTPAIVPAVLFMDGTGALYGGEATSQSIAVTNGTTPCSTPDPGIGVLRTTFTCTQADFTVAFDATPSLIPLDGLSPRDSSIAGISPVALPSHRVSMTSQAILGAHLNVPMMCASCPPGQPGAPPPVTTPSRDSLAATLTATVGNDVTFTFTVKNTSSKSVEVRFNDGQQFDIRVWNDRHTLVWRWGAGQAFPQLVSTRTIASGESVTFVEHWTPPVAGKYDAMAYLTSSSHAAVGFVTFTRP